MTRVKRKGTTSPNACESASFGRPWRGWWISTTSLKLKVEVAEVVQGVEDELPLRGLSAKVALRPQKIQQAGHEERPKGPALS